MNVGLTTVLVANLKLFSGGTEAACNQAERKNDKNDKNNWNAYPITFFSICYNSVCLGGGSGELIPSSPLHINGL